MAKQSALSRKSISEPNFISDGDPGGSLVHVLVVDDYEPFREFVRSILSIRPEVQMISEVSDGLEAVQKAVELQPALVVLDIGLPSLGGLEAARRIRRLSPTSKMLFLSQESSADVVEEGLGLGALGFVIKAHAASDLPVAIEAVLRNEQFVSKAATNGTATCDGAHDQTSNC